MLCTAKALPLSAVYPISTVFHGFCFQVQAQGIAELRQKLKYRSKTMTKELVSCGSAILQIYLT